MNDFNAIDEITEIDDLRDLARDMRDEIERLRKALAGLVDDEPCWKDHHGYCQAHGLNDPCEMEIARKALEQKP